MAIKKKEIIFFALILIIAYGKLRQADIEMFNRLPFLLLFETILISTWQVILFGKGNFLKRIRFGFNMLATPLFVALTGSLVVLQDRNFKSECKYFMDDFFLQVLIYDMFAFSFFLFFLFKIYKLRKTDELPDNMNIYDFFKKNMK